MNKNERLLLWTLAATSLVLRALAFFRYRFDADEQHHLHVAWGWTAGMVQYRDYFDNHAPLFHLATAPMLAMFGERADILLWMRIPMLVTFAVVIACTYILGRELYDRRIGLWAAVVVSLFPPFFLKSLEYRTDNLWTALWMLTLVAFVRGKHAMLVGLLLGAALAVSLKTTLLLATLLITIAIVRCVPFRNIGLALAGFAIVPGALVLYFVNAGAWDALVYCTITFNKNLAQTPAYTWIARVLFFVLLGAIVWTARRYREAMPFWPYFFAIAIAVFTITLAGFWLLISPRDFLPIMPLLAIFVAAGITRLRHPLTVFASIAVLCIGALWYYADRFENKTDWHITMMNQALRLTRPGEFVMDLKGETIYRPRPYYFVFERITREQLMRGLVRDTVAEDVVRTRTHVAQADGPMWPPRARAFLSENFVNLGRIRASGQWLKDDGTFTIAVPGEYVVLNERGEARGVLDGSPYRGARALGAGTHRFERAVPGESVCVVWAQAYRRGHSPFHLRDLEF